MKLASQVIFFILQNIAVFGSQRASYYPNVNAKARNELANINFQRISHKNKVYWRISIYTYICNDQCVVLYTNNV